MKLFKSHFWYDKRQRNGVFFLIILLILLQSIYFFVDFSSAFSSDITATKSTEIRSFQQQIDSLKRIALATKKPKIYPFNPNFITDYKGYQLGMTPEEIDKLHQYRKQRKFVNSSKEFQQITNISDSLLHKISPYFKFPDWVVKRHKSQAKKNINSLSSSSNFSENNSSSENISGKETSNIQKKIIKININTASFKEILKIPHINYELCKKILEYREEVAELQNISEIKNIAGFPADKYDRIALYLKAE
ncbi:helix-hairpin-helix domain-containing protein [Tenacibaculum piscium]|uniref:helix-hairpin-helix domain-containing protein n=1 Tax=Tenacibaculum piscium TaxID=1458515 RepID=UPI001F419383|nr:helix-hairpin-helix domain-containing protein [Tenacibaculum piscium]